MTQLSKSDFLSGSQCLKQLWWRRHDAACVELQPDRVLLDLFDQGRAVGERAREQFVGGVLIQSGASRADRVRETAQAMHAGASTVFEGAFEADGVFVATDVLHQSSTGWQLIEVKSASAQKDEHVLDAAVQAHVLTANGVALSAVSVMHLNKEFRHPDVNPLFALTDVSAAVVEAQGSIAEAAQRQVEVLSGPLPTVAIGAHCLEPRRCVFHDRCWPRGDRHISTLYLVGPKKTIAYMARGIHTVDDLPPTEKLNHTTRRQLKAMATGELQVAPDLANALEPFANAPLGFLDFETISRAVPVWPGMAPWAQAAAQFSYHESQPGGYRHEAFLAEGPDDARPAIAQRLIDATRSAVKVVTYSSFEKTQIRALQQAVPDLAAELQVLEGKLIDLLPVVREHVYHPAFRGSFSIKYVLQPMVPELSYNDLVIVNGLLASVEIARLLFVADKIPAAERSRVRSDLLAYCERDTWATVRLLEELWKLV